MPDITCIGILVADVVGLPIDQMPDRGKLSLVDRMELHSGGCAANTGISLAKIGIDTAVIGNVGQDGFGDFMVNTMAKNGIDPSGVHRDQNQATSATMVMVHSDGERTFIHYLGANATFCENDIDMSIVNSSKLVHIAGSLLMPTFDGEQTAAVLKKAKQAGVLTSLDTCWDSKGRWMELIAPSLPYLDYIVPSIEEAKMLTGKTQPDDIAKVLMDAGVGCVALKMGSDGCYVRTATQEVRVPRFTVKAIDALGAGDSFAAGFLAGVIKGWDMEQTATFANAVGACCVMAVGATTGIRNMEDTLQFIQDYKAKA